MRVVETRGYASPEAEGWRGQRAAGVSGEAGGVWPLAVRNFGHSVTGQAPTRTIAFVVWASSAVFSAGRVSRPKPPLLLRPRGARTPGFPAPPPRVSASGRRLVLSRAHLWRPDAGIPRGGRILGGEMLSYNWGRLGGCWTVGTRRLYLARNPLSPPAEEGRMFLPRAWPAGARCGGLLLSSVRPPGPRGRRRFSRARASCSLGGRGQRRSCHCGYANSTFPLKTPQRGFPGQEVS